jgi:hypothetical protein
MSFAKGYQYSTRWWAKLSLEQRRAHLKKSTDRQRPYFAILGTIGGSRSLGKDRPPPIIMRQLPNGTFVKFEGTWPEIWQQIKALANDAQSEPEA